MADVHLRLTQYEAEVLRATLGNLPATAPQLQQVVGEDVWQRLGYLLQPARAQVRRADPPRNTGKLRYTDGQLV